MFVTEKELAVKIAEIDGIEINYVNLAEASEQQVL